VHSRTSWDDYCTGGRHARYHHPTTDLLCQSLTFLASGLSLLTHFGMVCVRLIIFLMAFVYPLIAALTCGTKRITYLYFGPSEIRALLVVGNLLSLAFGVVDLRRRFAGLPRYWFGHAP
jgi:hypothetical protein